MKKFRNLIIGKIFWLSIYIVLISKAHAQQLNIYQNDLSSYGLSYSISHSKIMKNRFSGVKAQGRGSFLTSSFIDKTIDASSQITFTTIKHDALLKDWLSILLTQRAMQTVNGRYVSYNNIQFYEVVAKSGEKDNMHLHYMAVTHNNGHFLLYEGSSSFNNFSKASQVLADQITSFKFTDPYKPNVKAEMHSKVAWHNYGLILPASWQTDNTTKIFHLTIPNAKIEVYHATTTEEAQKHVATLKQVLQKVDITKNIGKLQQMKTKQGWETILMLSPKMKTDATTWMRAEYVLAQVVKGLAAQSAKKTTKIQNNIKANPQQKLAYQKAVKARQKAIALAKAKQQQGQAKFLAAIDKRNKSVISDMDKRLKAMTKITKHFEGDIQGLNAKAKKAQKARKRAALRKKQVSTGMVAASGGFGRWGSDKQPIYVRPDYPKTQAASLAECKLSRFTHLSKETNCIPTP